MFCDDPIVKRRPLDVPYLNACSSFDKLSRFCKERDQPSYTTMCSTEALPMQ